MSDSYMPPSDREWLASLVKSLESRIDMRFQLVEEKLNRHDDVLKTLLGKHTRYTGAAVVIAGAIVEVMRRLGIL
jgi:hypothetical protein